MQNIKLFFVFEGRETTIQSKKGDLLVDSIKKFLIIMNKEEKNLIFSYKGKLIELNDDKKIGELYQNDKTIKIVVYSLGDEKKYEIKVSPYVICPKCKKSTIINIDNYMIKLIGCESKCVIPVMKINDFANSQLIDESKIKCHKCENTKYITYNNAFYSCSCGKSFCPICKKKHINKKAHINSFIEHKAIDYDKKNFICNFHSREYDSYCTVCLKNLCLDCISEHNIKHKILPFNDILPDNEIINKIRLNLNQFKNKTDIVNKEIKKLISMLELVSESINEYYRINLEIINNFSVKEINYQIIENVKKVITNISNNESILKDLNKIIRENDIKKKAYYLLEIFNKMDKAEEKNNYLEIFNKEYNTQINGKEIRIDLSYNDYNTTINKPNKKIDDYGLNIFTKIKFLQLKELHLINNKIINTDSLRNAKFEQLQLLLLGENKIRDIDFLKNLRMNKLQCLALNNNEIIDISILENSVFIDLKKLYLYCNKIKDLNVLSKAIFPNLGVLNLSENDIIDINPLENTRFNELEELYLHKNQIKNTRIFKKVNFINLKMLSFAENNLKDINFLEKFNCIHLQILDLAKNKIENIIILEKVKFPELEKLGLSYNLISDINAFKNVNFSNLKILGLFNNNIDDFSILSKVQFYKLEELYLGNNKTTNIKFLGDVKFPHLKKLGLDNIIKDLTFLKTDIFKELKKLGLEGIDLSYKTNLGIFEELTKKGIEVIK